MCDAIQYNQIMERPKYSFPLYRTDPHTAMRISDRNIVIGLRKPAIL